MAEEDKTQERLRRVADALLINGEVDLALLLYIHTTEVTDTGGRD